MADVFVLSVVVFFVYIITVQSAGEFLRKPTKITRAIENKRYKGKVQRNIYKERDIDIECEKYFYKDIENIGWDRDSMEMRLIEQVIKLEREREREIEWEREVKFVCEKENKTETGKKTRQ